MPQPYDSPLFSLLRGFSRVFVRGYHTVTPLNACPIPRRGPAIIAPNHTSALDPLIVQSLVGRPIVWMMAAEYMSIPCSAWFWRATRIIPVARDGKDSSAVRSALRVLREGGVLGIFPEGRIEPTRQLLPLQPGIAHVAHRGKTPITPVWIDGSQRNQGMIQCFLRPNHAIVTFGKPCLNSPEPLIFQLTQNFNALQQDSQSFFT